MRDKMSNLRIYSNRHIKNEVQNVEKNDWIYLENSLSRKRWKKYFVYNNVDESKLNLTYITKEEFLNLKTDNNKKYMFDVGFGNPPYSKNNKGKGGTSVYQTHSVKAMELCETINFTTPGAFDEGIKFEEMRNLMDERGIINIDFIPVDTYDANVVRPCKWLVGPGGNKTVEDFFATPEKELFKKITDNTESFICKSGKGDVSTSSTENISIEKTETHPHVYVDRVKKDGPIHVYCNDKINMDIDSPLMVFAQRAGLEPKMFYDDIATSYSQNVMAIQVENKTVYDNIEILLKTNVYKFLLLQLSGGRTTTKAGFPGAFTKGKIEKLPKLDLSIVWTDEMLKNEFNLNESEVSLILDQIS